MTHPQRRANDVIRVVGFDPSLRNWGVAKGILYPGDAHAEHVIEIQEVSVIKTDSEKKVGIRQNSQDLDAAETLAKGALAAAEGAQAIFVEVPVNSQSARAALSVGVCIGVLGALRAMGIPFFEVSPTEVKMITGHGKNATKRQMIDWAIAMHSDVAWPTQTKKGITTVVEGSAEHMADAVAAIYAGLASKSFKQMLPFLAR